MALGLVGILITVFLIRFGDKSSRMDSYTYLISSDKDDVYERLLHLKQSEKEAFDSLLLGLISPEYPDMLSQNAAIRYIRENRRSEFLPELFNLETYYGHLNQDSVWYTYINDQRLRNNVVRNSALISDLEKTIIILNGEKHTKKGQD